MKKTLKKIIFRPFCRGGGTGGGTVPPEDGSPEVPVDAFASFRSDRGCAIIIPPPTAAAISTQLTNGGTYQVGDILTYRIYSYLTIGGTRYYSSTYLQSASETIPDDDFSNAVVVNWTPANGVEGYRVLRELNGGGYVHYTDIAPPYSTDHFIDGNDPIEFPGWSSGSTVTPTTYTGTNMGIGIFATVPISTWVDLTGNGHDLLQTTENRKPFVVPTQLNGFHAVVFDGTDDRMQSSSFPSEAGNLITILCVIKAPSVTRGLIELGNPLLYRSTNTYRWLVNGEISSGAATTDFCLLSLVQSSGTLVMRVNGVEVATGGTGNGSWSFIGLLTSFIAAGGPVSIVALDIWNLAKNTAQLEALEAPFLEAYDL